jgi:hypothetical protein
MIRRVAVGLFAVLGLLVVGVAAMVVPLADVRPATVALGDDPAAEAEGRGLLAQMLDAHGGAAALHAHEALAVEIRDTWVGVGKLFNPWPDHDQRASLRLRVHTFDSSVLFHNGAREGQTWGIREGQVYRVDGAAEAPVDDAGLRFMLPTAHYFLEMPQRLTEAQIVRSAGRERVGDVDYDVVFATWGTVDANATYDQYRIYLDSKTHRLAKAWYTVREKGRFVEGVAHMDDQREVGGFWFAHRVPVTMAVGDDPAVDALHTMVFSIAVAP